MLLFLQMSYLYLEYNVLFSLVILVYMFYEKKHSFHPFFFMNLAGTPPYKENDSVNCFFNTAPAPNTA